MPVKSKILIVDDHPVVRWGMSQMLNQEDDLEICCEAGNEAVAMKALANCRHDLVIVDLSLEGVSGLSLIKSIKALDADMPILVMSMHDETIYAERALRAGARGYIMKHEAPDNILRAIRQTLAGDMYVSDKMRSKLLAQIFDGQGNAPSTPVETLSDTELEVLKLVGKGLSTRASAELMNRSVKTIESHRRNIQEKLQLKSSLELVRFATRWIEPS
ncbi:MAG: response regulator transcription factor [Rhodoferax sp.]|uniref:response regulator transcription factor n=1 Tax=Rhodoferax sp. TaxID=50421 RepID=UPI002604A5E7|nr:response regulator transcription factor [Rhodoferax sp.]MDD5332536.1 response regulator transcription factor [Rhodoferax sp.]